MAAWVYRIESDPVTSKSDASHVSTTVSFWDAADVGFTNELARCNFVFDLSRTPAQMQAEIVVWGQQMRTCQAKAAALKALAPVGSTGQVP